ncbi:MAG: GerMN domain-containing protein [Clostridia bacterium]|nr:GerMN domain-containing protein [Clostridia bacterium]
MKKAIACLMLALALIVALEPHVRGRIIESLSGLTARQEEPAQQAHAPSFSQQLGSAARTDMLDVTLYFRFADTNVLGAQRAQIDIRREETIATSIVQHLLSGPDIEHKNLSHVFPQGTELISVSGEGATAYVTLSSSFLGKPDGAPADWEDSPQWQEEAALRRRLAVQSIVLALTEGGRYQRVQLYIADSDDDIPQRISMAWLDTGVTDPALVLAASPRDEQAMLTPSCALEMIMDAWQRQDWQAMYSLMADTQDDPLPTLSVFEAEMAQRDVSLLEYSLTPGTVSFDGQSATIVLDAVVRAREGGDAQIVRESVPLVRVQDNWAMQTATLQSLMIRD